MYSVVLSKCHFFFSAFILWWKWRSALFDGKEYGCCIIEPGVPVSAHSRMSSILHVFTLVPGHLSFLCIVVLFICSPLTCLNPVTELPAASERPPAARKLLQRRFHSVCVMRAIYMEQNSGVSRDIGKLLLFKDTKQNMNKLPVLKHLWWCQKSTGTQQQNH